VDQAIPLPGLLDDFDGQSRAAGNAPDLGADELGGGGDDGGDPPGDSGSVPQSSWGCVKGSYRA
jgi:hypothetical protein